MSKTELILDSGAYSAWVKKEPIDVHAYAKFALEHLDVFDWIINLDVIPGEVGVKGTDIGADAIEAASREGYKNYETLLNYGVPRDKLIHVFHQEEKFYWLEKMVGDMDYIGLSPANDRSTKEKKSWLRDCMPYVTDSKGMPTVKFHGFGVTSFSIMYEFPWYSVDSGSWMQFSKYGAALVPRYKNGSFTFFPNPYVIFLSGRSPSKGVQGKHIETLSEMERERVLSYFKFQGFELGESTFEEIDGKLVETVITPGLCNDHKLRDQLNLMYYLHVEANIPEWPWAYKTKERSML